jgi:hypothetical protein
MRLLQHFPYPVHDFPAHYIVLPELTAEVSVENFMEPVDILVVQTGDGSLFLYGHISQDFLDDLIYVGGSEHDFSASSKIFNSASPAYFLGHQWPGSQASTNKLIAPSTTPQSTGSH